MGPEPHPRLPQRVAWFIALWLAGVATVALIGHLIRAVLL